jgi:carboxyl-terminal processing protease
VSKPYYLLVVGERDGSPAARAGIRSGDFIRAIDDVATRDMSAHTGTRLLAGEPGSRTTLLILRANTPEPRPIELVRELPATTRATARRLAGGEAYVRVSSFGPGAADQIRTAVASLGAAARTGVIIDLRDTADGTPAEGATAARLFIKAGTIATLASRRAEPVVTVAGGTDGALTMPVVLLVSIGTGNAAEVFAAAMADNQRASLVGTPTAGLAGVQTLVRLPDDHGLLLTTARYVRADGTPIGERLRPEVLVEMPIVGFDDAPPASDAALDRAREVLRTPARS